MHGFATAASAAIGTVIIASETSAVRYVGSDITPFLLH